MSENKPKRPEVMLSVMIDKELHRIFKIYCINNKTSMTDFIITYIERIMSNHNSELTELDQRQLKSYLNQK